MDVRDAAELLVALGTLILAIATVFLGFETRRMARETQEGLRRTHYQHQEALTPVVKLKNGTGFTIFDFNGARLSSPVINTGLGPALKTKLTIALLLDDASEKVVDEYSLGPIGPNEEVPVNHIFMGIKAETRYTVTFKFENLFGARGKTTYISDKSDTYYFRPPVLKREDKQGRFNTLGGKLRGDFGDV
ncbi:MAG TPA: hypothetical protein VGU66_02770 [Candidatus Elarobacter sp.]|nr:hypothetical protein [Candidatus Elarobacter sp.]